MPYNFLTNSGTIVPDESTVLAEVQQEYRDIFGANLDVSETSPQGKLIASEVASRIGAAQNNANVANQLNPNLAEGVFFDAIWALLGGSRIAASRSVFSTPPPLTGVAGTLIPAGAIAQTPAGDRFLSISAVTLDGSGNGSVGFQSEETGAIAAGVGALTSIVTSVIGWETINNTVAATPGTVRESGAPARQRRRDTIGLNGRTGGEAIVAALRDPSVGVTSLQYRQNVFSTTQVIDTITMVRNSIYVCVDGGTDEAVGRALLSKSAGQAFNGPQSVTVTDPESGPQEYIVNFDRTAGEAILIRITVNAPTSVTVPIATIRQSVLDYANGIIGDDGGFITGRDVLPFEIGAAINLESPLISIRNVEISNKASVFFSSGVYSVPINEKATILESDITVTLL